MRKAIGFLSVFLSVALINIPAHAQDIFGTAHWPISSRLTPGVVSMAVPLS